MALSTGASSDVGVVDPLDTAVLTRTALLVVHIARLAARALPRQRGPVAAGDKEPVDVGTSRETNVIYDTHFVVWTMGLAWLYIGVGKRTLGGSMAAKRREQKTYYLAEPTIVGERGVAAEMDSGKRLSLQRVSHCEKVSWSDCKVMGGSVITMVITDDSTSTRWQGDVRD